MSNTEDFDAETEELDGELETPEAAPAKKGKPPAAKKSGGGMGKFLMLLIVLGLGGAAGGEKLGLIKLPFDIPGLSPVAETTASTMPAVPAPPAAGGEAATGELAAATGSDAVPPGLEGDKPKEPPSEMPDPLGAPSELAATHGKPSIQPPSSSTSTAPPAITAPGSDQLAGFDDEEPAPVPAPAADPLAAAPAPATDPLASAPVLAAPAPVADPLAAAPAPAADPLAEQDTDPLATPGGPDMLATPVAPVETAPVASAPDMSEEPAPLAAPFTAPVVAAAPDTESLEKIAKLEEKVSTLEQDLAAAQKKAADSAAALAKAEARATAAEAVAGKKAKQHVAAAPVTGEEPVATKPRAKRVPRAASSSAAAIVTTSRWVLKSAKPGVAWVALPGSNELKTIAVGDTVTGLGRVTAIAKDDSGRWVVNGTKGRINQ